MSGVNYAYHPYEKPLRTAHSKKFFCHLTPIYIFLGPAQATMQMESSLTCRKRKANEINDEYDMDKVWGIITDAEKWYFMECTLDEERKPSFRLLEPVIIEYNDENMQIKVEKVLGHIVWLLDEAQKPDSAFDVDKEKVVKKHRSLS